MENRNVKRPPRGPHGMNMTSEKPNNFKQAMSDLIKYCKPYYIAIIISTVLATVGSICSIIGPNKLSDMADEITKGLMGKMDFNTIKSIALLLLILYITSVIFNYINGFIMATVTNKFTKRLRNDISIKINKLPLKYFDKNSYGDTLSRVTNDVDTIGQTMNNSVGMLVSSITLFLGSVLMMFITNWIMALTAIASTIIGFVLMFIILSKSQKYFKQQQEELGNINGHIEEMYSGHNVVRVYNGVRESNKKFDEINDRLYNSARKSQFISGMMQPIMMFIGNFGYLAVCIVGAMLVIKGKTTIGSIVAFMVYVRLFTNPLSTIAQSATQFQSTAAASERAFEFLNEEEMVDESNKKKKLSKSKIKGNIEFKNVKFGYEPDKTIIKDFSAKVKSGQKIAIVGPTGAGKTTMVNLLMKFYDINEGDIIIDGVSIKELTREQIHELFIMVLQDTWLFNGTIKENIVYNKENVSDKEVVDACKTVGIDHFIRTMPHGYDSVISDSESISVGQKQLITIARGMIKDAPFLILDEATSSVDTRTEETVQKAMDKLTKGRTSFIIAHRLSTIKNADLILVMKDGNIIEQGNHKQLLNKKGFYADLYNSQFEKTM
jgi:ATP-binding cassette subfamily B protein